MCKSIIINGVVFTLLNKYQTLENTSLFRIKVGVEKICTKLNKLVPEEQISKIRSLKRHLPALGRL